MVLCICLNPSIDKYVNEDNQLLTISYGGKAINTAVTLSVLGIPASVIGFVGKSEYDAYDDMLTDRGISNHLIPCDATTRTNIKTKCADNSIIEHNESGFIPDNNSQILLLNEVEKLSSKHDIALISGSIPPGLDTDYLLKIIDRLSIPFILDTYPADITRLLEKAPLLIKPNRYELSKIFHTTFEDISQIHLYAQQLLAQGVQNVLISLDKTGALLLNNTVSMYALAPSVVPISTVGAGDSMIAGFIYAHLSHLSLLDTLKSAVAAGTAHTLTIGTLPMDRKDFENLKSRVIITNF